MAETEELYANVSGGRVLDVGTGRGGFVLGLIEGLKDYKEIVGIDIHEGLAEGFAKQFADNPRVRFQLADALSMPFDSESFDTVAVAGSLHHISDPRKGLIEMMRVLRRGGHLIVVEMYRDGQTETQQTHVMLHHWWAAVDRLSDKPHRETYTRDEVMKLITDLGLAELATRDEFYLDGDPHDPNELAQLEGSIDDYIGRAAGHPDLVAQGAELLERLRTVGFHEATFVVAVGGKR